MITYPSTNGVFEETIADVCQMIHDNGGQVRFSYLIRFMSSFNQKQSLTLGGMSSGFIFTDLIQ
jgi:hypothetical protein